MLIPPISRYMTPTPFVIEERMRLTEAGELMREHRVGHLPVVDHGRLVGLVCKHDLLRIHSPDDVVQDAMSPATTVGAATPIDEVVALMETKQAGSVVVVQDADVTGIFTRTDAMRALVDLLRHTGESER